MTAILSSIAAGTSVLTDAMSGSAISSTKHFVLATSDLGSRQMEEGHTMIAMRHYLGELAQLDGSVPAEPIIRALIDSAVSRLHLLCRALLARRYPRLARPPLNLQAEELLGAIVDRLLRALQQIRPTTVRQFFALANRHMRWELNDLARCLDARTPPIELRDALVPRPSQMIRR